MSTPERRTAKEARLAAARARRASWVPTEEVEVTVGDIVEGDFTVTVDRNHWRDHGFPIESRRFVARVGDTRVAVIFPAAATAVVRRPIPPAA